MAFIDLGLTTDAGALADNAIAKLQEAIPDYVPQPGNLEVIQIDALAPMAAEQAQVGSVVPSAIFRGFGTKLVRVPYRAGATATAAITLALSDTAGHTV